MFERAEVSFAVERGEFGTDDDAVSYEYVPDKEIQRSRNVSIPVGNR